MLARVRFVAALAFLVASSTASAQTTWWVDHASPDGGDGSQISPFRSIQAGIVAAQHGDRVQVLPGTYAENLDFLVKSITVASTDGPEVTLIQGDATTSVVRINANQAELDGFTVTGGAGSWMGNTSYGGGILLYDAHAVLVTHCVVRGNYANAGDGIAALAANGTVVDTIIEANGGPAYPGWCFIPDWGGGVLGPADLWLDHCTIRSNSTSTSGGGVSGASLIDCEVRNNYASEGAGLYGCYARSTLIAGNQAYSCDGSYAAAGGALHCTLEDCTLQGNAAQEDSGGAKSSVLHHCALRGNTVAQPYNTFGRGGGATDCVLEDCLVEDNSIHQDQWTFPGYGGGTSGGRALRTIIRGNSASDCGGANGTLLDRCLVVENENGGVLPGQQVRNSIVRGNLGGQILGSGPVVYCDVEGGFAGTGNFDLDPLFWNAAAGDFHLQPGSPCIDAGHPEQLDPDGTRVDLGAFPYDPLLCLAPVAYCAAGHSSEGCVPSIQTLGSMSLSMSSGFEIRATSLPGQRFVAVIYGVSGAIQNPWGSGDSFSCVAPPRQRTGVLLSDGTSDACDGSIALDFSAWLAGHPFALGAPFAAGDVVWAQTWYRDPGSSVGTNFTDAVRFMTCP